MWPDRVSNPGPPTYESDALPIALRGPAHIFRKDSSNYTVLRTLKLHSAAFGMFLTPRMVTPFDLNHCYILLLNG